jgi:uncharacterized damage-inducible protein DinB
MRTQDVLSLFDYNYWATWSLLTAAKSAPPEAFTAPRTITWRNLRDTLVHTLDVEQSWRRRLQGEPREIWDAELSADRLHSPSELERYWRADAAEMTTWLAGLGDAALAAVVDLGRRDRFPMWFFLVHIVTHGIEQRRDAETLLTQLGIEVPELEFLWYADSLQPPGPT